jgi:hypothetical protein
MPTVLNLVGMYSGTSANEEQPLRVTEEQKAFTNHCDIRATWPQFRKGSPKCRLIDLLCY